MLDDRGIEGLDDLTEYLGEMREYADDLWQHASRPRRRRADSVPRTHSALKVGEPPTQPSPFASLPNEHYRVIYSDPPWRVHGVKEVEHYKTMTLAEMRKAFPVITLNDPKGTVHFMWVVSSLLDTAIELIQDWGYTYKTIAFCWVKTSGVDKNGTPVLFMGQGGSSRGGVELCLQAYSGKNPPSVDMNDLMQVVVCPLGDTHSAKPAEVRNRIVELYPDLPRLEMFARDEFEDWDVFGDETKKAVPQPTDAQALGMINVVLPKPSASWWAKRKILTTAEAAEMLGVSRHRVIDYIRSGRLDARKQGNHWAIGKRSVMNFAKKPRDPKGGRPKK